MRFVVLAGLVAASLAVPAAAQAAGPAFGGAGQLVVSDDQPLGGLTTSSSGTVTPGPPTSWSTLSFEFGALSNNGGSGTEFSIAPAADYFVIPNLSIGGNILFGILSPAHGSGAGSGPGITYTAFGIAPRVGYNVPITDMISIWPKLYFSYLTASGSNNTGGLNSAALGIFAPIMFVPATHFILGIGPNFSTQLGNNATQGNNSTGLPKLTQVGIQATIGGWFLGD
jgi:hypothetical protein